MHSKFFLFDGLYHGNIDILDYIPFVVFDGLDHRGNNIFHQGLFIIVPIVVSNFLCLLRGNTSCFGKSQILSVLEGALLDYRWIRIGVR